MIKGDMVTIKKSYREERGMPLDIPALILRPQYEKQIQLTEKITACELMIDVLIGGKVYEQVPSKFCKKIRP
jgi:hypothetical protein